MYSKIDQAINKIYTKQQNRSSSKQDIYKVAYAGREGEQKQLKYICECKYIDT